MKQVLILAVLTLALTGCYNGAYSSSKSKTFSQQIAELETQPVPQDAKEEYASAASVTENEADRAMDVAAQAQKERRAEPPLVESNYIFNVIPDNGTYAFDEYNQVVTDDPKAADYKAEKRLWTKPKRIKPDTYENQTPSGSGSADTSAAATDDSASADSSSSDDFSYEDEY